MRIKKETFPQSSSADKSRYFIQNQAFANVLILSRPKALTTPLCAFHILQHFQGKRKEIFLTGRLSDGEQENFLPGRLSDGKAEKFPAGKTFYRETASAGHECLDI